MRIDSAEGDRLSRSKGYFMVDEAGEYEFQAFGDDRAAFQLHLDDGTTLQSITNDYAKNADDALKLAQQTDNKGRAKSTTFTVTLEANKAYPYTLIAKNTGGIGWADVNIRRTSGDTSWKSITKVYSNSNDIGKVTDKSFTMPEPEYVRPSNLAAADDTLLKGLTVISTPQGVIPNSDPKSHNEGIKENIVDGDISTYFHSSYDTSNQTPFPHEYIFDLGGEKSFNKTKVNNVIAQNSSFIQYEGDWKKDSNGAFVIGATYNTNNGYFMYCFEGKESNIYVTKDTEVEIRVDGGKWEKVKLKGTLREPSITLNMANEGKHVVEVRAISDEIALNMISTDGVFYKGQAPAKSNPPVIHGADNIKIGVGQVATFDNMKGVSYTDDIDTTGLQINVTGELGEPTPGTNEDYILTYTVTDSDRTTTTVNRVITVTNQLPEITGLDDIVINEGEGSGFDFADGVTATDLEDGNLTKSIQLPTMDLSSLTFSFYRWITCRSWN